jgi:hypothetical protein
MANLIVSAVSTFDNKGLKKGQKDISAFDKSVKSLGKTFAGVFGAAALINFGKKAVAAFAADQAAAKALEVQLKNTGYAFSAPDVEYYIANLQKMTGVLDDHLRPAFQTLLTASGSLFQSQSALQVALDTSAATGMSLEEVSSALAAGYRGQTKALRGLGVTLSKTALTAGHMSDALQEIGAAYSGQSAARLETYAGKMDKLAIAASDATEIIGKGLLDALSTLGTDKSLDKFSSDLNSTATSISYLVAGVTSLAGEINKLFNIKIGGGSALDVILRNAPVISAYYNAGKSATAKANAPTSNFTYEPAAGAGTDIARAKEALLIKKAAAARALELTALNKKNAVDELKNKFDLERIGLNAALNSATDDETKLRLKSQLAILDNNEVLAKKYLAELNAAEAVNKLANDAAKAGNLLVDGAAAAFARLALYNPVSAMSPGQGGGISNAPSGGISTNVVNGNNSLFNQPADPQGSNYNITLELAPNAGEFGQLVYNSFLLNQKNGNVQNYAGGNF